MGNSLGAMVFIAGGITLGYWVLTGRATNFLQALGNKNAGGSGSGQSTPLDPNRFQGGSLGTGLGDGWQGFGMDVQAPGTVQTFDAAPFFARTMQPSMQPMVNEGGGF